MLESRRLLPRDPREQPDRQLRIVAGHRLSGVRENHRQSSVSFTYTDVMWKWQRQDAFHSTCACEFCHELSVSTRDRGLLRKSRSFALRSEATNGWPAHLGRK